MVINALMRWMAGDLVDCGVVTAGGWDVAGGSGSLGQPQEGCNLWLALPAPRLCLLAAGSSAAVLVQALPLGRPAGRAAGTARSRPGAPGSLPLSVVFVRCFALRDETQLT